MENIIKSLRKEKGLTQVQLAETFNLDQTTISKWENGKALPDSQLLIRLSKFFDVSTDYLLGISSLYYPDRIKTKKSSSEITSEEQTLLDDFRSLPIQERAQAIEYVHYLADKRGSKNKHA